MYRAEVLAALGNAVLLSASRDTCWWRHRPHHRPARGGGLAGDAGRRSGLVANIVSFFVLRSGARESLNVRGAYLEVLADLIGSVGC